MKHSTHTWQLTSLAANGQRSYMPAIREISFIQLGKNPVDTCMMAPE